MKKARLAGLFLLAPLTLLAACGGNMQPITFHANWYSNTSLGDTHIEGTSEQLEYAVDFRAAAGSYVSYTDGVYKTELVNKMLDGNRLGYVYTTDLTLSVTFSLGGQTSETFTDNLHSEVEFLPAGSGLRPVKSTTTVLSHSPLQTPLALGEGTGWTTYDYTYTVTYNSAVTEGTAVYAPKVGEKTEITYKIPEPENGTYLDNAQILFALRGIDYTSAISFRSVNTVRANKTKPQTLTTTTPKATNYKGGFTLGEEQINEEIAAYSFSLYYNDADSPASQNLVYAAKTEGANRFRNVMLSLEIPVSYSYGTLCYTLKSASFTNN